MAAMKMTQPQDVPQQGAGLRQKHMNQLTKTELCKFFLRNACGKGKNCHFAHSLHEIREKPDLTRTSMCQTFLATGSCENVNCQFAHSEKSLRCTSGFFKTKLCRFVNNGRCKHGSQCRFAHSEAELGPPLLKAGMEDDSAQSTLAPSSAGSGTPPISSEGNSTPPEHQRRQPLFPVKIGDYDSEELNMEHMTPVQPKMQKQGKKSEKGGQGQVVEDDKSLAKSTRHCTTIMLTNVPTFLTQGALLSLLEDKTPGLSGNYDFFYCPWNPAEECNLGYAIINFLSRSFGAGFEKQWADQRLVPRQQGCRNLRILPAALQGRAANLRHFSGFALALHPNPRFRPLVRAGPDQPLRPMTTRAEGASAEVPPVEQERAFDHMGFKVAPIQQSPTEQLRNFFQQHHQEYGQQYLMQHAQQMQHAQVNGVAAFGGPPLFRGYPQDDMDPLDMYAAMGNGRGAFGA